MKKILVLLVITTMVLAGSILVFADDTEVVVHELSPEVLARVQELKAEFLSEKVSEGLLTQDEADDIIEALINEEGHDLLKDFGFGIWVRESDYAEELFELMPHKAKGERDGMFGHGNLTEEEIAERIAACETGEFTEGFGMGHHRMSEDGEFNNENRPSHGRGHRFNSED